MLQTKVTWNECQQHKEITWFDSLEALAQYVSEHNHIALIEYFYILVIAIP